MRIICDDNLLLAIFYLEILRTLSQQSILTRVSHCTKRICNITKTRYDENINSFSSNILSPPYLLYILHISSPSYSYGCYCCSIQYICKH